MMIKFQALTLFPEYFESPLKAGLLGRAIKQGLIQFRAVPVRDFAPNRSGRVDEAPFGGGDSMILSYGPLRRALESLPEKGHVICLSPKGALWSAKKAREHAAAHKTLTVICGRYGGVDERLVQDFADEEISLGDYVLSGGEAAFLALLESVSRFVPGFLGNRESAQKESFEGEGLLEAPQWTRPRDIEGLKLAGQKIPSPLLSGNHGDIEKFRRAASLVLTALRRPDLLAGRPELLSQIPEAGESLSRLAAGELKSMGLSLKDLAKCKAVDCFPSAR